MSGTGRRGFFERLRSALVEPLREPPRPAWRPTFEPPDDAPDADDDGTAGAAPSIVRRRVVRPPGAIDEAAFLAACTRCGRCVEACPEAAIVKGPDDTPRLEPERVPCVVCADVPCAAACPEESGALVHIAREQLRIGVVGVSARLCINHHEADACEACLEWCKGPQALRPGARGIPVVDEALCVGCGLCVGHCKAYPRALGIRPR
ncbi:MAG: 4Fe-4S binding protein [Deltaproteobacteria bacterium]|nr:4Fe-4S binding protein [Deltaproteobacteria bacterium]